MALITALITVTIISTGKALDLVILMRVAATAGVITAEVIAAGVVNMVDPGTAVATSKSIVIVLALELVLD